MSKDEELELVPETEDAKKNVMQSAKDFMNGVLHPLKGKDLGQLVEDFTSEMTLVAEGLSEDQQKLFRETDKLFFALCSHSKPPSYLASISAPRSILRQISTALLSIPLCASGSASIVSL